MVVSNKIYSPSNFFRVFKLENGERDLLKVLKKNRISGAGLDVMVNEPISMKSSFLKLKNVIITPHIAGVTNNFWDKQISLFFENLIRYKRNSNLQYLKNFSNIKEGY